uniref:Uncharacterized protein n=1 Tax=Rhizophora mucronata TaxID=61149 RepID=A0A2P2N627_RHIMU
MCRALFLGQEILELELPLKQLVFSLFWLLFSNLFRVSFTNIYSVVLTFFQFFTG